jgi:CheY-like chemotaxis protein
LYAVDGRSRTVLVVDDDPTAVELIASYLPAPAYAVVRAYGGDEAIGLAQRVSPDLILLDLIMPEMSGFEVVEALHRDARTANIPILVITARDVTESDRDTLNRRPGSVIRIVGKAGIDRAAFLDEVRRALVSV